MTRWYDRSSALICRGKHGADFPEQNVPYDKEHKKNAAQKLSEALGNVTVLQKGGNDIISNGKEGKHLDWTTAELPNHI